MYNPNQQMTTQGSFGPHMNQQMELERVPNEDGLLAEIECPLIGGTKGKVHWTEELHNRFVGAVSQLGGVFCATPKRILPKMKVRGLTSEHIKSHLQKARSESRYYMSLEGRAGMNHVESRPPQLLQLLQGEAFSPTPVNGSRAPSFQAHNRENERFSGDYEIEDYNQNNVISPCQSNASSKH